MARSRRAWRWGVRVALAVSAVTGLGAVASVWWNFGVFAPNCWYLWWTDGVVIGGAAYPEIISDPPPSIVTLERRPSHRSSPTGGYWSPEPRSAFWFDSHSVGRNIEFSPWLVPLPPLAFCVLAYWMSRLKPGCCSRCAYDLAGLTAAPGGAVVCPECGAGAKA